MSSTAQVPQLPKPECSGAGALQQEQPQQGGAHASQLNSSPESAHSKEHPAQPQINNDFKKSWKDEDNMIYG